MKFSHLLYFAAGWILSVPVYLYWSQPPPEPTCAELRSEIWAFQQCLKFKPSCKVAGPESFTRYHKIKNLVAEDCPESADDYLSEIK